MTNKSKSEFLHPTITPGDVNRVRLFGQNTRSMPSLFSTIITYCQSSERSSSPQLLLRRDSVRQRSTVNGGFVGCEAVEGDRETDEDER